VKVSVEKPRTPEEIVHFGVKGMRWGVQKKQETSGQKSITPNDRIFKDARAKRRERRAKGHEAVARKEQKAIDLIKANPSKHAIVQFHRNNLMREHAKERDLRLKDAADIRAGKLTTFQKKAIVGASATAAVLGTYGAYKVYDSGSYTQFKNRNIPLKRNDALTGPLSFQNILHKVVKPVNPDYDYYDPDAGVGKTLVKSLGSKMNCRRATFAYEMRRRGYDVEATKAITGTGQTGTGLINATTPGRHIWSGPLGFFSSRARDAALELTTDKTGPVRVLQKTTKGFGKIDVGRIRDMYPNQKSKAIFEAIGKNPDGARGELGVLWNGGRSGHSMAWEIIGGRPHIFDAQSGKSFTMSTFAKEHGAQIDSAAITRLDNIELNENFLKKWVTNV
jgi:hypothetical protein